MPDSHSRSPRPSRTGSCIPQSRYQHAAFLKANRIAACRSARLVNVPSPISFMLITPLPACRAWCTCSTTSFTFPEPLGAWVLCVHPHALLVHPDHADLQPLVRRNLPQRRQPMHASAVRPHRLPVLVFQNHILPARRVARPRRRLLHMQQHDVEIIRLRQPAQLVDLLCGSLPSPVVTFVISR